MTPLEQIIRRRIAQSGPISVGDYMDMCLSHPQYGYYITRDPFGSAGDFTTAPEISQMFGELIGLWLAQVWSDQGSPSPFALVELGPGRGTLMADVLRATRSVPGFRSAGRIWLVETSPVLRARQAETLRPWGAPIWTDSTAALPDSPTFLIANEFFDALPIRQFVRSETGWREKMISVTDGHLRWGLAPDLDMPDFDRLWPSTTPGELVETSIATKAVAASLGGLIARNGGSALAIDYGAWHGTGDTLQAVRSHKVVEPLTEPGNADLTAHVNFSQIAEAAEPLKAWPLRSQGQFLTDLGIARRAAALSKIADNPNTIAEAFHRLTGPSEMGTLFKVLCMTPADAPTPPGFSV